MLPGLSSIFRMSLRFWDTKAIFFRIMHSIVAQKRDPIAKMTFGDLESGLIPLVPVVPDLT